MFQDNYLQGGYSSRQYSERENLQFAAEFKAITLKMVACLDQGLPAESEQMQQAIAQHLEFCRKFWKPNRQSYKALAMSFILPTGYRDTYEEFRPGLGKYVYEAINAFADCNLN